nr:hypothetical protein BaRGS_032650 [Batillaria attramentaria]
MRMIHTLAASEHVVYDRIFSNIGSAYSSTTGVFTCPQSGLYVFQIHSLARSGSNLYLKLYHNYQYVLSVWGHTDNDFAAAGNSCILQLTKGDEVYVAAGQDDVQLYGDPTEVYATFSGYLVSPVFQEFPVVG